MRPMVTAFFRHIKLNGPAIRYGGLHIQLHSRPVRDLAGPVVRSMNARNVYPNMIHFVHL
jgi:hypothetical protein